MPRVGTDDLMPPLSPPGGVPRPGFGPDQGLGPGAPGGLPGRRGGGMHVGPGDPLFMGPPPGVFPGGDPGRFPGGFPGGPDFDPAEPGMPGQGVPSGARWDPINPPGLEVSFPPVTLACTRHISNANIHKLVTVPKAAERQSKKACQQLLHIGRAASDLKKASSRCGDTHCQRKFDILCRASGRATSSAPAVAGSGDALTYILTSCRRARAEATPLMASCRFAQKSTSQEI